MKIDRKLLLVLLMAAACMIGAAARAEDDEIISPDVAATGPSQESLDAACAKYAERFNLLSSWLATPRSVEKDAKEREQALKLIDEPLLYDDAKELPCVGAFFRSRMNVFMKSFKSAKVDSGLIIWKLYNHTEIIQTKSTKIAIDLYGGYEQVAWDEAQLREVVGMVDALLVTHPHADHYDRKTIDMFVKAGKPVVVPYLFMKDYPDNDKLTVMREGELKIGDITVKVFPSYQKKEMDNVYLLTTDEGYKVMHLGDENEFGQPGHEWYSKLKPFDIDILIPNIWTPNMATLLRVVKPKLIFSSHEHEVGHPSSGRRSYDYVYKVLRTIKVPYAVPMWGESVRWPLVPGEPPAK